MATLVATSHPSSRLPRDAGNASLRLEAAAAEGTARCPRPQRGIGSARDFGRAHRACDRARPRAARGRARALPCRRGLGPRRRRASAPRPPRDRLETQPIAWVYEVSGSRVSRVTVYRTWEQAREAAGVAPRTPPTRRLSEWRLAIGAFRSAWQARSRASAVLT